MRQGLASVYISSSTNATLHAQQNAAAEAIFVDSWGLSQWSDTSSASKLICERASSELTPIGSAEWIKVLDASSPPHRHRSLPSSFPALPPPTPP